MKRRLAGALAQLLALNIAIITLAQSAQAATYRMGSSGEQVRTIQTKLKNWGYYSGAVDGIYGAQTAKAVEYFQRKNGLTADGIVGPATLRALGMENSVSTGGAAAGQGGGELQPPLGPGGPDGPAVPERGGDSPAAGLRFIFCRNPLAIFSRVGYNRN